MEELRSLKAQVDKALIEEENGTPGAHEGLLRSIDQLKVAALGPTDYLLRLRYAPIQNASIVLAAESGMLEAIVSREGRAVTAEEIAKETGVSNVFVKRIMRMLTVLGICEESSQSTYKSNAVTHTVNDPGNMGAMKFISTPTMKNLGNARSFLKEKGFPMFGSPTSFQHAHGCTLWEYLRDHPDSKRDFDSYMSAQSHAEFAFWFDIYPAMSTIKQAARTGSDFVAAVDIAGGRGHDLVSFKERYPDPPGRLVLEDLPETFSTTGYMAPSGIEVKPYDFFTPQPIKGARIYFLHHILHDWSDEDCRRILLNTVEAMDKDSILLIQEFVVPNTHAGHHVVYMDILMMFNVGGIERTAEEWQTLIESVGLELVNVWPSEREAVIEARLKQ